MATYTLTQIELYITEQGKKLQVYNLPHDGSTGSCGDQYDLTAGLTISANTAGSLLTVGGTFIPGQDAHDDYNYANHNRALFINKIIIGTGDIRGLTTPIDITNYDMSTAPMQLKYNTTNHVLEVHYDANVAGTRTRVIFDPATMQQTRHRPETEEK